jgi:TolB protein
LDQQLPQAGVTRARRLRATMATLIVLAAGGASAGPGATTALRPVGPVAVFAPDNASTAYAEIRLTISPDGRTALWFSRDRPGGAGGYDLWLARRTGDAWGPAAPAPFNSPDRDFDPAFSADGRFVYFCSDRPGGLGGDDIWRVAVAGAGFGAPENLGPAVNSRGDEFAPMLSRDGRRLLFSSDRPGGGGGHDLFVARRRAAGFAVARRLEGRINTAANEFDATFLADDATIVFARTPDFAKDRVDLFVTAEAGGAYRAGSRLPEPINDPDRNTYGPMIDWSRPDHLLFSARRDEARGMDLYSVRYRLRR